MSIASEDRPVWGDSDLEESLHLHSPIPDSDEEQRLARQMGDAQAAAAQAAHANAMASGRRHNIPRLGPVLMKADQPRAQRPKEELFRETRGMGRFAAFHEDEFQEAYVIPARYRISSLATLRAAQKGARAQRSCAICAKWGNAPSPSYS